MRTLVSAARDGTDRVYLNALAPVRGLKFSHSLPGGSMAASWNLLADPEYQHRALFPGRLLTILSGATPIWTGALTAPLRGNPWQCAAVGDGAQGAHTQTYAPGGNPLDLGDVLGDAVTRGALNWTLPGSLPTGVGDRTGAVQADVSTVDLALLAVTKQLGETWWVDNRRRLVIAAPPTDPQWLFAPAAPSGGRALNDDYVSAYLVTYTTNNTTGATAQLWVRNSTAEAKFGVSEAALDLTSQGVLTAPQATTAGNAELAAHGPRVPFTDALTLTAAQVLTVGGVTPDLASMTMPIVGRLVLTDPDRSSELSLARPTTVLAVETEFDDDAGVRTVTPTDTTGSGFVANQRALHVAARRR